MIERKLFYRNDQEVVIQAQNSSQEEFIAKYKNLTSEKVLNDVYKSLNKNKKSVSAHEISPIPQEVKNKEVSATRAKFLKKTVENTDPINKETETDSPHKPDKDPLHKEGHEPETFFTGKVSLVGDDKKLLPNTEFDTPKVKRKYTKKTK